MKIKARSKLPQLRDQAAQAVDAASVRAVHQERRGLGDLHAAKLAEAHALLSGDKAATPIIVAEAKTRKIDRMALAEKIIAASDAASAKIAAIEIERIRLKAKIATMSDEHELTRLIESYAPRAPGLPS